MEQPAPKRRGRPRQHPPGYRNPGTPPDTSLHLGDERREWLRRQGGIQTTIKRLIDEAMNK